eukprot:362067-Chlamydomonas_euryale.AAC.1
MAQLLARQSSELGTPTGGLAQMPSLKPSVFQCAMRNDGLILAMLRLMSEMVALPRIIRPHARYVERRGSARMSWCSRLKTSENT